MDQLPVKARSYAEIANGRKITIQARAKSFEDVVKEGKSEILPIRVAEAYRNEPFVPVSNEEIVKLSGWLKYALIGKFSHSKPSNHDLHHTLKSIGFHGSYTIGYLDAKHILINFELEEDYARLFMKAVWFIKGCPIRVLKYTVNFDASRESSIVPIWIALPKLPLIYYDKAILYSIATAIGSPLKIDEPTAIRTRTNLEKLNKFFLKFIFSHIFLWDPPLYTFLTTFNHTFNFFLISLIPNRLLVCLDLLSIKYKYISKSLN